MGCLKGYGSRSTSRIYTVLASSTMRPYTGCFATFLQRAYATSCYGSRGQRLLKEPRGNNGDAVHHASYIRRSDCAFGSLSANEGSGQPVKSTKKCTTLPEKEERALEKKSTDANIVLRAPVPKNFIKETFLPHLEHNVAYNASKFPPSVVLQIGIAYSKLPVFIRQRPIEDSLVETFIDRMVDYNATECVQLMNTSLQLQGLRNVKVYHEIMKRLKDKHVFGSITVLNRLGIVRSISRILQRAHTIQDGTEPTPLDVELLDLKRYRASLLKPWTLITSRLRNSELKKLCSELVVFGGDSVLPQLEFEMQNFDSYELSDLLGVLAERAERDSAKLDFPIIAILMQRIIATDEETPLVNKLSNICSLCRLQVVHPEYMDRVIGDLHDPLKVNNIFHRHLARSLWAFSRLKAMGRVFDALIPHLERNAAHFEPSSLARLAQVYSAEEAIGTLDKAKLERLQSVILRSALHLLNKVDKFTPKDVIFFYTGMCYFKLIPAKVDFDSFIAAKASGAGSYSESEPSDVPTQLNAKGKKRVHFLEGVLGAMQKLENDFDLSEIRRIISITESMDNARYVIEHLPESWSRVIKESGDDLWS